MAATGATPELSVPGLTEPVAPPAAAKPVAPFFQDRRTGKRVIKVGGDNEKEDIVLVKGGDGVVYFASLSQLMPCDAAGVPDFEAKHERPEDPEEAVPPPIVDIPETRLNVNTATAEEIARRIPGIGYRVAKKVVALKMSMPGEVFRSLDQVKAASTRTNWDEVFRANVLFIG